MAVSRQKEKLLVHFYQIRMYGIWISIVLIIIASVAAFFVSKRFTRPLQHMITEIRTYASGKRQLLLPTNHQDEIGEMARAFEELITKLNESEKKQNRYMEDLERSNSELDDFAYIASHDLKEPIRGLANNALFLKEDFEDILGQDGANRLKRMESLINELLYFSRLGRQDLAIQPVNLNDLIKGIEEMLETTLSENNAKIIIPEPLPTITCDVPRITEVFRNLITNAIKYNKSDFKVIEVGCTRTNKSDSQESDNFIFHVIDNGIGIKNEFFSDIFRIFKRLNSEDDDTKGSGVGLTFVQKIIERHGGKIWLESKENKGTTFFFTLNDNNENLNYV